MAAAKDEQDTGTETRSSQGERSSGGAQPRYLSHQVTSHIARLGRPAGAVGVAVALALATLQPLFAPATPSLAQAAPTATATATLTAAPTPTSTQPPSPTPALVPTI